MSARRFAGAAVFISGGAHGIGKACAVRLAAEGARCAIADVDEPASGRVVEKLGGAAAGHVEVFLDVTQAASVDEAVAAAVSVLGGVDVVVNVAGGDTTGHGRFEEVGDEVWLSLLELNLLSVSRCCRAAIPHLRRSTRHPAIVNVSSVNALVALGGEPYSAAKAGVISLTQNLAATLAADGIRVNAVAPGTIRTRVWDHQEGGADRLRPLYPLGRVGEPDDVAAAVAFLASADASWITGHTLPVDGGLLTGWRP